MNCCVSEDKSEMGIQRISRKATHGFNLIPFHLMKDRVEENVNSMDSSRNATLCYTLPVTNASPLILQWVPIIPKLIFLFFFEYGKLKFIFLFFTSLMGCGEASFFTIEVQVIKNIRVQGNRGLTSTYMCIKMISTIYNFIYVI